MADRGKLESNYLGIHSSGKDTPMRLGGPIFDTPTSVDHYIQLMRAEGYTAAYFPLGPEADDATIDAYVAAMAEADILIAEVPAFGVNPIHPDTTKRKAAIERCSDRLALAERVGARCCVNIAGTRHAEKWADPHPANFTQETFDLIVESTRAIIDAVKPTRTFYTLEMMPNVWPESADQYLELIRAIDRPAMAVHLDPVNIITSPMRAFDTAAVIRDCFAKLGPHIRSCHAKDIALTSKLTVHLDEVAPGEGLLDYPLFLSELAKLDPDMPVMLEHLPTAQAYRDAAQYIRKVAAHSGLRWR